MGRGSGGGGRAASAGASTGTIRQRGLRTIQFTKPPKPGLALVEVSTSKLDAAWQKDEGYYVPPGGGGAEIRGRREQFKEYLKSGKAVEAPTVDIDKGGTAAFRDGRHRFSVLRDQGYKKTYVAVDRKDAARVRNQLG